jgi:hypothetical protein
LPFIDVGLFKDRAVAMGKPHCNRSIRTFLVMPSLPSSTLHGILVMFLLPCPSVANLPLVFDSVVKPSHCAE